MSILSRSILKTHFETGDRPTQTQFENWLDSYVHMNDDNIGTITILGTLSATTGSFGYINITGTTDFDSITVGGGYMGSFAGSGLSIDSSGALQTDSYIYADGVISSSVKITTPIINNIGTDAITVQNPLLVLGSITASGDISASGTIYADAFESATGGSAIDFNDTVDIEGNISASGNIILDGTEGHLSASRVSASAGFEAGPISTSSFGYISASGDISTSAKVYGITGSFDHIENIITNNITASHNISASGDVIGYTGSFQHLTGDGSGLSNINTDGIHGNKPSTTGSIAIPENTNNTVVTNNTGEFTVNSDYTVKAGAQVDLQYTPIAERLYRYDVDTGAFKAYAQANIDSETTLMKGFGAGTAGVGNDSTVRHNATVPENFTVVLHTNLNVTQSEDPNNNPMTTDPHSITIQDNSTYTIKQGADVTVDGVHHGVIRKDIALFKTMGIGDTQAIGPSGSYTFNDQYNNIYPSASAHLHISASKPRLVLEAKDGAPEISLIGSSSMHAGYLAFKEGATNRNDPDWTSEFRFSYNANESKKPFNFLQINKDGTNQKIIKIFSGSSANTLIITGSRIGVGTTDPQKELSVVGSISASGDVYVGDSSSEGIVLTAPNGNKFRFTVDNSGHLTITGSAA